MSIDFNLRRTPNMTIIDLHGRFDASAGDVFDNAYAQIDDQDAKGILLNFAGVEFISSAGIAMIIGLIIQATKAGRRLLACNLSDHYIKIFQTARLSDYINVFPSEAAALDGNQGSEFQI
jgi:anti-anti-sigma factor